MAGEAFNPLPHSLQMQLWGHLAPEDWLTAQVQDSAVLVAEDWVVSIHGKNLSQNVSAMAVLVNTIGQELDAPVSVDFPILQNENGEPLHISLKRQSQRGRIFGPMRWGAAIIVSALVGAVVQWVFFGGGLP